jgi:hypothetical protein
MSPSFTAPPYATATRTVSRAAAGSAMRTVAESRVKRAGAPSTVTSRTARSRRSSTSVSARGVRRRSVIVARAATTLPLSGRSRRRS